MMPGSPLAERLKAADANRNNATQPLADWVGNGAPVTVVSMPAAKADGGLLGALSGLAQLATGAFGAAGMKDLFTPTTAVNGLPPAGILPTTPLPDRNFGAPPVPQQMATVTAPGGTYNITVNVAVPDGDPKKAGQAIAERLLAVLDQRDRMARGGVAQPRGL